jgi:hypothetical protein
LLAQRFSDYRHQVYLGLELCSLLVVLFLLETSVALLRSFTSLEVKLLLAALKLLVMFVETSTYFEPKPLRFVIFYNRTFSLGGINGIQYAYMYREP